MSAWHTFSLNPKAQHSAQGWHFFQDQLQPMMQETHSIPSLQTPSIAQWNWPRNEILDCTIFCFCWEIQVRYLSRMDQKVKTLMAWSPRFATFRVLFSLSLGIFHQIFDRNRHLDYQYWWESPSLYGIFPNMEVGKSFTLPGCLKTWFWSLEKYLEI